MQYALLINETAVDYASRQDERAAAYWAAWTAFAEAINGAGIVRGGAPLNGPDSATTIRVSDEGRIVQDGPFADTKEQLGGFFIIEVDNLDAALEWAARCPSASTGSVEVRPLLQRPMS
jgi:hypothetical protein